MPYPPPPAKELPVVSSRRPGDGSCTFCRLDGPNAHYLPCYVRHCTEMYLASTYAKDALIASQGCPHLYFQRNHHEQSVMDIGIADRSGTGCL